ncbi:MAG: large conductance mechanosensitive channel protein MscL [Lachnospiraceae bacterium]|nr:large conductance mechanosensitive channel protein MscL [Lachnospiraceae bacterium]
MKGFMDEFKQFIMRGNVMDMAVGMIIGAAFTAIVSSLNDDIISPILGIFGGMDFSDMVAYLPNDVELRYGAFITAVINFLITAFVIFLIMKAVNKLMNAAKKPAAKPEEAPKVKICPYCRSEIAIEATRCPHCTSQLEEKLKK